MDESFSTPCVVIDLAVVEANIRRFQAYADAHGLAVRPHIKTHKIPAIAERQLAAGAIGLTCQKIAEAEAMIDASPAIRDVFITYDIVGADKLARLRALAGRVRLSVVADGPEVIAGLAGAFADAPQPLTVLVECDTGARRCGVGSPERARDLALAIAGAPGLTFGGLMTYPPAGGGAAVQAFLAEAARLIDAAGLPVAVVSSGGSPDMFRAHEVAVVTEHRPGTYVYNDRSLVERGVCGWDDCALTVHATVVSVPDASRAIVDAGSKILTSDLFGLTGHGHVLGRPDLRIDQLSEEHGRIVADGPLGLAVGDRLRIVPNHACVVSNMVDAVHVLGAPGGTAVWPVVARGRMT
ncbi:D-TA family PLP-dependent enzyme [Siculibacillus lacustris]|uniref:D-TA family PLP-dependent enzyme n=1 Tax=Siculibacillus lacustris TaxID=1549641 RepID=A0A4V2KUF9_9HYPH|nr:D-TA family PLP-dependent enzyme [Siculibacillus lacustris]TBW41395.1 D-TA family PLP-dependent enzyme [Siculibacillus lacustris]